MVQLKLVFGLLGAVYGTAGGTYLEYRAKGVAYRRLMNTLIQSPGDSRGYRMLRLKNRLEVLLVSSSKFRQATASLDVDTGYRDDPAKAAGLAHLVEHLLFTGSDMYPEQDGFEQFSKVRGGAFNAYTVYEHTNFFFSVAAPHLQEALERFSAMFISPRFAEAGLFQELPIIEQEYHKHRLDDATCSAQVVRSLSSNHSFGKFAQGNTKSLAAAGNSILEMAKSFFQENYSTTRMKLVVAGRESLDELTEIVVPLFSHLPRGRRVTVENIVGPQSKPGFKKIVRYVPASDREGMQVLFFLPAETDQYETKPAQYLTTLLERGGKGSPADLLSLLGYSNGLECKIVQKSTAFSLLMIKIDITAKGLENYMEILHVIFQDIRMLKRNFTWHWHYHQKMIMGEIEFRFAEPMPIEKSVRNLATQMHAPIPVECLLIPQDRLLRYDDQLIETTLDNISPDGMTVLLQSRKFLNWPNLETEPYYGSRFNAEPISNNLTRKLRTERPWKKLAPPEPNPFLPTDFSLVKVENDSLAPYSVKQDDFGTVWHANGGFETPHAEVRIFISNRHSIQSSRLHVSLELIAAVVNSKMQTLNHQAKEAGMRLSVEAQYAGIAIQVSGFSHKMELLLASLASLFSMEKLSNSNFDSAKGWLQNLITKSNAADIPKLLQFQAKSALIDNVWSSEIRAEDLKALTLNDTKHISKLFLLQIHIDALVLGNISPSAAKTLVHNVVQRLGARPSSLPKRQLRPNIELPPSASLVYEVTMPRNSGVAATLLYLDMYDYPNSTLRAHTELLAYLLRVPFMDQFRNKELLSISAKVSIRRLTSRGGIQFAVESTHDPGLIELRINSFLTEFEGSLVGMSQSDFQHAIAAFLSRRCAQPTTITSLAEKLWYDIRSGYYDFHADTAVCQLITTTTKAHLLQIYHDQVLPNSPNRRKLSIRMVPPTGIPPSPTPNNDTFIRDLHAWKINQKLSPLPYPITHPITPQSAGLSTFD